MAKPTAHSPFACCQPPPQARQRLTHLTWYPLTQTRLGQSHCHTPSANEMRLSIRHAPKASIITKAVISHPPSPQNWNVVPQTIQRNTQPSSSSTENNTVVKNSFYPSNRKCHLPPMPHHKKSPISRGHLCHNLQNLVIVQKRRICMK